MIAELKRALPSAAISFLRRFVKRGVLRALSSEHSKVNTKRSVGCARQNVTRLVRILCAAQTSESLDGANEAIAKKLIEVAELSAAVAVACTCRRDKKCRATTQAHVATDAQKRLERCLKSLRFERVVSAPLAGSLSNLCWHAAWDAAWKQRLVEVAKVTGKKKMNDVAEEIEFQRRLNDLRAELATDGAETEVVLPLQQKGWRGVNLGGWLVWEHGPCNSAPIVKAAGGDAPMDEWTLSLRLREKHGPEKAAQLMREHRMTFVTKRYFEEIAALGFNAVRIPFSYWLFDGPRPDEPFLGPDADILDRAFQWALETGLKVILCFHGTVGFQSDHQASGRYNQSWTPECWDQHASLQVLRRVAARYKDQAVLGGICVVNEPSADIPLEHLRQFYKSGYHAVRDAGVGADVQVILPLYHREIKDMKGHFSEDDGYSNVVFDEHTYHVFGEDWSKMSLADHLRYAAGKLGSHDLHNTWKAGERVIASEWSLALPVRDFESMIAWEWWYLTQAERNAVIRSFAMRQLRTFAAYSDGWFFWSWKDEDSVLWSLRDAIAKQLLPMTGAVPNKPISLFIAPAAAAQWYRGRGHVEGSMTDSFKAASLIARAPESRWRRLQNRLN
jgi:glucan 1,3-beta-glucosidase